MPTRCNRGFYCRSYCLLNMFWAPLCPSSGAQEYYTMVAACGILCCKNVKSNFVSFCGICVLSLKTELAFYFHVLTTMHGQNHIKFSWFNHLTPNGHYMVRTAQLTSRCCILYIYSTNIRAEYFKHAA